MILLKVNRKELYRTIVIKYSSQVPLFVRVVILSFLSRQREKFYFEFITVERSQRRPKDDSIWQESQLLSFSLSFSLAFSFFPIVDVNSNFRWFCSFENIPLLQEVCSSIFPRSIFNAFELKPEGYNVSSSSFFFSSLILLELLSFSNNHRD